MRRWLSMAAAVSLALVIGGLVAFALWQNRVADQRLERLRDAQLTSSALNRGLIAVFEVDKGLAAWMTSQDPTILAYMVDSAGRYFDALEDVRAHGSEDDRQFAEAMDHYSRPFYEIGGKILLAGDDHEAVLAEISSQMESAYQAFVDAIASGELGDAAAIEAGKNALPPTVGPFSTPMTLALRPRAEQNAEAAASLAEEMQRTSDREETISIIVYSVAGVLSLSLIVAVFLLVRHEARTRAHVSELRQIATTDPLTGLRNRRGFEEETRRLASAGVQPVSLVMMDLDEFKNVNDTFGHDRGDEVLRGFAEILARHAPGGALNYRIGGDEFASILPGHDADEAFRAAEAIRTAAEADLTGGVTVSLGVANLEDDDEALFRQQADAALYEAKLSGRNVVRAYSSESGATQLFPAAHLAGARQLLVEGNVQAVFQPIWDLHTGTVLAFEGLSRPDPRYGLSGPQEAFDIAERFGRSADLDRICRQRILEAAAALPSDADIFINLSPYTLTHRSFDPLTLAREVHAAGIAINRVAFEVTERSQVSPDAIADAIRRLRDCGFRAALDDVGAGNNGLEMLRKVPVDVVKIDRAVIIGARDSGPGRAALMAILAFAAESEAVVVAEGIEDEPILQLVRDASHSTVKGTPGLIHGVQGYLFTMPAPAHLLTDEVPSVLAA
jgi:diguanylate cyclase (GGDEF)-like protein